MFIECPSCKGDGEGVFGHSWTTCPLCNGAGQVLAFQMRRSEERPIVRRQKPAAVPRCRMIPTARWVDLRSTDVFPEEKVFQTN